MAFSGSWTPGNIAGIGHDPTGGCPPAGASPGPSFGSALNRLSGGGLGGQVNNIQINNNYGGVQNVGGLDGGGLGAFSGGGLAGLNSGLLPGFLSPLSQLGSLGGAQNETDKLFQKTLSDFGKLLEKLLATKAKKGKKGGKSKKRGPKTLGAQGSSKQSGGQSSSGGSVHVHADGTQHVH